MGTLERAVEIARRAHKEQTDKRGGPYLDHVTCVAARVGDDPATEAVALLHDIVAKGPGRTLGTIFRPRASGPRS